MVSNLKEAAEAMARKTGTTRSLPGQKESVLQKAARAMQERMHPKQTSLKSKFAGKSIGDDYGVIRPNGAVGQNTTFIADMMREYDARFISSPQKLEGVQSRTAYEEMEKRRQQTMYEVVRNLERQSKQMSIHKPYLAQEKPITDWNNEEE